MQVQKRVARLLVAAAAVSLLLAGVPGSWSARAADPAPAVEEQMPARTPLRLGPETPDGRELLDERTRTSRTYLRDDGSRLAILSAAPVNFRDGTGAWRPIDNTLTPSLKAGFAHENEANSYDLQLPSDLSSRPVQVSAGGHSVSFALQGASGSGTVSKNAKTYRGVLQSTDLRLTAQAEGVKEDLVLRDVSAPNSFRYSLTTSAGLTPRLNDRGGVDFIDSAGQKRFAFAAPYMYDASGTAAGYSENVRYSLTRSGSGYTLGLSADHTWLQSPARQWPVVIDPTLTFFPDRDCFITGGTSQNTSFCGGSTLDVGWDGSKASRALLYWDIGSAIPDARDAIVLNAKLSMHLNSKTTSNTAPVTVHRVTNEWFTDATWNKRDGLFNINWTTPGGDFEAAPAGRVASVGGSLGWQHWYPTNLVQDWLDGSAANHGVLIKQENENVNNVLRFGSSLDSNYPQLRITYHWRTGLRPFYTLESDQLSDRHQLHVNPTNGNLVVEASDLQIAGTGLDLDVSRYYNGLAAGKSDFGGREFGGNWVLGTGVDVYLTVFDDGSVGYYAPSGFATRFLRNDDGSFRSPNGIGATLTKDQQTGTFKLTAHADGSKQNFRADGMLSSLEDANGNKIEFTYVASNWLQANNGWKLTQIRDTQGRITTFTYNDTIERLTQITDPSGRTYKYGYNGSGDLTSYTDPANKITTYIYSAAGLLTRITDPKGNQTRITYDTTNNRVLSVKRVTNNQAGTGPTTSYSYALRSEDPVLCDDPAWIGCAQTTDPNGNKTKYYYDPHRLVRKVKDALGNNVAATYTADFNIATSTSASNRTTTDMYSQDGRENLEKTVGPTGTTSQWEYEDPAHKFYASKAIDSRGEATSFKYDSSGNLEELTNPAASENKAVYSYNANGTVATATDFKGNITRYGYDALGRLTSVDNSAPLGDTSYTYDALSRVHSETDGRGQTTTYIYDALDRTTSITYHDGSTITYVYDANGNVLSMADNTGTVTYEYDALNRLTKETLPGPKVNSYFYDNTGNLSAFEDAGGRVNYIYNAVNLLVTLTEPSGRQITFAYDIDHMRTETRYPNGVTQFIVYDAANRIERIYAQRVPGGPVLTDFVYTFVDPETGLDTGLRHSVTDTDGNRTNYRYDLLGRLDLGEERSATGTLLNSYAYSYDANSNRTSQTVNGVTTTYDHNPADQLTRAGTTTFSYDANGNELSRSDGRAAVYNPKDQASSMTRPGGSAIPMSYSGTGQSRRVSAGGRTYQNNALGLGREQSAGAFTTYLRDQEGLLLEQRGPSGDHYYLFDGAGSVVAMTDASGNVATTYKYEPFGTLVSSTGTVVNPWRWLAGLGVYWDEQVQLHKMGARYYDSTLGRFTQVDPVDGGALTAYDYAYQNPVNAADPDGTAVFVPIAIVALRVAPPVIIAASRAMRTARHAKNVAKTRGGAAARRAAARAQAARKAARIQSVRAARYIAAVAKVAWRYAKTCVRGGLQALEAAGPPSPPSYPDLIAFGIGCISALRETFG
jgi:RHS repeat-associated protein